MLERKVVQTVSYKVSCSDWINLKYTRCCSEVVEFDLQLKITSINTDYAISLIDSARCRVIRESRLMSVGPSVIARWKAAVSLIISRRHDYGRIVSIMQRAVELSAWSIALLLPSEFIREESFQRAKQTSALLEQHAIFPAASHGNCKFRPMRERWLLNNQ